MGHKNQFEELGLDAKDRRLMYALDVNARASNAEIAKSTGLDKSVVAYRINRLVGKGVIQGFYTIVDATKLGNEGFRVYLKYQYSNPAQERELIDFLVRNPNTWWVGSVDGKWDIGFVVWARGIYGFRSFWDELMHKYRDMFQQSLVSVYTGLYHYSYSFLSSEKVAEPAVQYIGGGEETAISENEKRVLKVIADNARLPTMEIAKRASITPMIVKYAIKRLREKGVIKGFRTSFNLEMLGRTHYKVDVNLKDISKYDELQTFVGGIPETIYLDQTIGSSDFEPEFLVESHARFLQIMNSIKSKFPNLIKDYKYMLYSKMHKVLYYQEPEAR